MNKTSDCLDLKDYHFPEEDCRTVALGEILDLIKRNNWIPEKCILELDLTTDTLWIHAV